MFNGMTLKQFVTLHLFEAAYLGILAVLPFAVAKPIIGLSILGFLFLIGFASVYKKLTFKRVDIGGKAVFITGCDSGFGLALARRLASEDVMVFAGCLDMEGPGAEILKELESENIQIVPIDVTSDASVKDAVQTVQRHDKFKGLWCVVNNAGVGKLADVEFCSMDMYKEVVDINIMGTIRVTKACIPMLRKSKGRIINVSSADVCYPGHSAHALTKAAVTSFSNSLRIEMRKFDIKVITIAPGNFYGTTGMLRKSALSSTQCVIEGLYSEVDPEIQEAYSSKYLNKVYKKALKFSSSSCKSLGPVIDTMEIAIISVSPMSSYLVDGAQYLDFHNWLVRFRPIMPQSLYDYWIEQDTGVSLCE